jgi:hypothetical protein
MEFEWLSSKRTSGKLKGDDWVVALTERARLLARLRYPKGYTLTRCEQDLNWSFGDKSSWPVTGSALKKLVAEAYRVSGR